MQMMEKLEQLQSMMTGWKGNMQVSMLERARLIAVPVSVDGSFEYTRPHGSSVLTASFDNSAKI